MGESAGQKMKVPSGPYSAPEGVRVSSAPPKLPRVGPGAMFTPVSFCPAFGELSAPLIGHPRDKAKGRMEIPYLYTYRYILCQA